MFKPSFTVVTFVLIVFVLLAYARYEFIGLIPPPNTNALVTSKQKFLSYAGQEQISWHTLDKSTFQRARELNKPILLVIGTASSRYGQDFDTKAFEDVDTAQYVNLNFFCIRIDGYEHPEWINAMAPLTRLKLRVVPTYQVWTLDSEGHVLSFVGRSYLGGDLDTKGIYRNLVDARALFDRLQTATPDQKKNADMQVANLEYLANHPGTSWPSFSAYAEVLGTSCDRRYGGFPDGNTQRLLPNAWRFLTLTGYSELWRKSLGPLLTSRMVDVQDGGFFRLGLARDLSLVEFDKGTRQNADMMSVLAIQGQINNDPFYGELAKRTFDWLLMTAAQNVVLPACQEDDENPQGRSPRLSFPNWRLLDVFDDDDRQWARVHLGLDPMTNSQMVPYLKSRGSLLDDPARFAKVIALMKVNTVNPPSFNDAGYLDVNGHSLARMFESARLWNDNGRLNALEPLQKKLRRFDDSGDLIHWQKDESHLLGYLGDYLGISDALLNEYLATGRLPALAEGLKYLRTALAKFQGSRPGELNLAASPDQMGGFAWLCVPEIEDNLTESCTAQAIRLEMAYGRLTEDTESGQELLRLARVTTALFAEVALSGGPDTAGYYCSATEVLDDRYAVAVGPDAQVLADALYRRVPTRFVAPIAGGYRKDLQARKPGIYVIGTRVHGPYTVDEAAAELPYVFTDRNAP